MSLKTLESMTGMCSYLRFPVFFACRPIGSTYTTFGHEAHRGVTQEFVSGTPVSFAELLESSLEARRFCQVAHGGDIKIFSTSLSLRKMLFFDFQATIFWQ